MSATPLGFAGSRRFELLGHLGSGGMGSVFAAHDRETGSRVAVKTLDSPSADGLLYLKNEFRALEDVRHQNLAQLIEVVEEDGRFFVVMELIEGSDLLRHLRPTQRERTRSGVSETRVVGQSVPSSPPSNLSFQDVDGLTDVDDGAPDVAQLRSALAQLARGLIALHDRGKVHRDVKPSNVLVTGAGRVVLVDFGLTTDTRLDGAPRDARAVGTRAFMAPEQAAGQRVSSAADMYSFGVVLYLLLTGVLPFRGAEQERQKLRAAPASPRELRPDVDPDLSQLACELLDPDPSLRPDGRSVLARLGADPERPALLHATPFLGRDAELQQLSEAFADSQQRGVTLLVVGDSGLGKSALVRELMIRLARTMPQAWLLASRCYERELLPYKAFDGIVDGLSHALRQLTPDEIEPLIPTGAGVLARVFPVLERVPALAVDAGAQASDPQALRGAAFAALREILSRVAAQRPLLLHIDDLQWADGDSFLLLSDLLRGPAAPHLLLVATARPVHADHPLPRLREQLAGDVRELQLGPLPLRDSHQLAELVLGAGTGSLAAAIAREAAGLPLFVQALAEHARSAGEVELSEVRLEDALLGRIGRIEAAARRLLEVVAVAGAPLAAATAGHASQLAPGDYAASVASLRAARLVRTSAGAVERIEPYHDRIRETVLGVLEPAARRLRHASLAEALQSGSATPDPHELVRHLEGAERHAQAAEQAERGARRAEQALAFEQASELYQTALRLGSFDAGHAHALQLALAGALTNAGRAVDAARAYVEVARGAAPERKLEYRRRAADHLLRSGHLEDGSAILSEVLRELGADLGSQRRELLTLLGQRVLRRLRGLAWEPREAAAVPSEVRRRIEAFHAVGVSFALIDTGRGAAFEARALRLALDHADPLLLARTLVMEAGYEGATGESGQRRAARLLVEVDRILDLTGDRYIRAARRMIQGFLDYHAGKFSIAFDDLVAMEHEFSALPGCYFERAFCHCFRLICLRNAGRWGALAEGFDDWVRQAEQRGDRFTEASLRLNLNGVWLVRDDPDEALRDLARVSWMPPAGGYHVQHWYEQQARAEIALYTGRAREGLPHFREQLRAMSRSFLLRMRLHRCHAQWLLGRLILADAGPSLTREQRRELLQLVRQLRRENLGTAQTWSLLLESSIKQRSAQEVAAAECLLRAQQVAELHGLQQYAQAAAFQLGDRSAALAWAREHGIQAPERLFRAWVP